MNIFILDSNPILAARMHCDEHVSKMILESAQMLCTAAVEYYGIPQEKVLYRSTHKNHPCTKWVGEHVNNAAWLAALARTLDEIRCTNGKESHASMYALETAYSAIWNKLVDAVGVVIYTHHTPFVTAIAPQFYNPSITDPVLQYQHYYRVHKPRTMKRSMHWTLNQRPAWMDQE